MLWSNTRWEREQLNAAIRVSQIKDSTNTKLYNNLRFNDNGEYWQQSAELKIEEQALITQEEGNLHDPLQLSCITECLVNQLQRWYLLARSRFFCLLEVYDSVLYLPLGMLLHQEKTRNELWLIRYRYVDNDNILLSISVEEIPQLGFANPIAYRIPTLELMEFG